MCDYSDFLFYVELDPVLIEQWYLERSGICLDTASTDPSNYYYVYAIGNRAELLLLARQVWHDVYL